MFESAEIGHKIDKASYEQPHQMCQGIHRVMVNGQWAFANGQSQGKGQGRFLPRS